MVPSHFGNGTLCCTFIASVKILRGHWLPNPTTSGCSCLGDGQPWVSWQIEVFDGFWWFLMDFDGFWRFLMVFDGFGGFPNYTQPLHPMVDIQWPEHWTTKGCTAVEDMDLWKNGGFLATPSSLDGLFHGKSHLEMEDERGYPYDLGNLHMLVSGNNEGGGTQNWHFDGEYDDKPVNFGVLHPSYPQIEYSCFFLVRNFVGTVFW